MPQPTEVTRALAFGLVVNGIPKKQVARHLGIDPETLGRHYEAEIELGLEKANAQVARALFAAGSESQSWHAEFQRDEVLARSEGGLVGKDGVAAMQSQWRAIGSSRLVSRSHRQRGWRG